MSLMNGVFHEYLENFIQVFIDDILIYSRTTEEHDEHLRLVLQCLREHKLYGKLSKCSFYQTKIHYLGHVISGEGHHCGSNKGRGYYGMACTDECPRSV
jgi:hypothetical protein